MTCHWLAATSKLSENKLGHTGGGGSGYMPNYETSLYYTFSTIPQTLAAAFGILGAFVLFRLATLWKAVEASDDCIRGMLSEYVPVVDDLQRAARERGLKGLQDAISRTRPKEDWFTVYFGEGATGAPNRRAAIVSGHAAAKSSRSILRFLKWGLGLTVLAVLIPIVELPLVPWLLLADEGYLLLALVSPIVLTLICLILYSHIILKSLSGTP
jgi:hypothetical protein